TGDSVTIVTSRNRLTGLTAGHAAEPLALSALTAEEAKRTLSRYCGAARCESEPEAVTELVRHCDGLPLAIGVLGARIAVDTDLRLSRVAGELADASSRLDALETPELALGVRSVLDSSFRALSPGAARMFA